jgi:hypothetical protein
LSENKFGNYLIYALGEIIVLVIGILIALSINNWNEARKQEQIRQKLISNLISEFEDNSLLLKNRIEHSDSLLSNIESFRKNINKADNNISLDSLRSLAPSFFIAIIFEPMLLSLNEAKSTGSLRLLSNKDLSVKILEFQTTFGFYSNLKDVHNNSYFNGAVWELRKLHGTLNFIMGPTTTDETIDSYLTTINQPVVRGFLSSHHTMVDNMNYSLKRMEITSNEIVDILKDLKQ